MFIRGLENLEYTLILFSEFKALKVVEFPELALESCKFVNVNIFFILIFVCVNYGISDVSKYVNIASTRINVTSHLYRILVARASYKSGRKSYAVIFFFFSLKITLHYFLK